MQTKIFRMGFMIPILFVGLLTSGCERTRELSRASTLQGQGVEHYDNSDYHKAIPPLREAFDIRIAHLGAVHEETISTGQYLLICLDSNGDDHEALKTGKKYLKKIEAASGSESLPYAKIETFVGTAQADLGQFDEAIVALRHAKKVYIDTLGKRHEDVLLAMHNLNFVLAQAGYVEEALEKEGELLDLKRDVLGAEHRDTIKSITNLAFALSKNGEHKRALALHEESMALRKKVFGEDHPETYVQIVNLGVSYSRVDRLEEGVQFCREGYEFFKSHYPEGHPDIRWAALNLRNLLSYTDQKEERENLTDLYELD